MFGIYTVSATGILLAVSATLLTFVSGQPASSGNDVQAAPQPMVKRWFGGGCGNCGGWGCNLCNGWGLGWNRWCRPGCGGCNRCVWF